MVLVAIPGGTSPTLGKSLVSAILATERHKVIILSRVPSNDTSTSPSPSKYGAPIRYVDYSSTASLTTALSGVHTCISVLKFIDPHETVRSYSNLLDACVQAGVIRFAPAEWTFGPLALEKVDVLRKMVDVWKLCQKATERHGIQCARFQVGMFMNYLGFDCDEDKSEIALAGLEDDLMKEYCDIGKGVLFCPINSKGEPSRITMTDIPDIGKFVAASLDLEKWEGELSMGEVTTMRNVADILRNRCGRNLTAKDVRREQLDSRVAEFDARLAKGFSVDAFKDKLMAEMMAIMCDDELGSGYLVPLLNKAAPIVNSKTVEEYLVAVWGV